MESLKSVCGGVSQFLPLTMSAATSGFYLIRFFKENYYAKKKTVVDQTTQNIFQSILMECGISPTKYECKIARGGDSAFGSHVILLNEETIQNLKEGSLEKKNLARHIIKHEIGHLEHKDGFFKIITYSLISGSFLLLNLLKKEILSLSSSTSGNILLSVGFAAETYLVVNALFKFFFSLEQFCERRADQFAIKNATTPRELHAAANNFEHLFAERLQMFPSIYVGSKSLMKEFNQRKNPEQTLESWVIEHRSEQYVGSDSLIHPSYYDRARTLREAALQLEKNN